MEVLLSSNHLLRQRILENDLSKMQKKKGLQEIGVKPMTAARAQLLSLSRLLAVNV